MPDKKANIAVLVSGGGTNLQALIDAQRSGILKSGRIVLTISNRSDAYALNRARDAGIDTRVITKKDCGSAAEFERRIAEALDEYGIDLIVLAGFMSILSADFTRRFERRIINVHPSLIPSFCGKGMYGHHVHEAALEYGVKVSGATVHFVSEDIDAGPIVFQGSVPVEEGDTPDTLAARILPVEHTLLPEAVRLFCQDRIVIDGRRVKILPPEEAKA